MIILPIIGSIKGASKLAAANPIRLPECLAVRTQTAIATMMAANMIPNASLKPAPPACLKGSWSLVRKSYHKTWNYKRKKYGAFPKAKNPPLGSNLSFAGDLPAVRRWLPPACQGTAPP
jgi:hypothetical protein